jgi:hypothetical protein
MLRAVVERDGFAIVPDVLPTLGWGLQEIVDVGRECRDWQFLQCSHFLFGSRQLPKRVGRENKNNSGRNT